MWAPFAFADRLVAGFWSRVARNTDTNFESLACFRVCYCTIVLYFWAPYSAWVDRAPRAFFDPPVLSLANVFSSFPPAPFFALLDGVVIVCLAFMAVGFLTRWATAVFLVGMLLGASFQNSFGKIDHCIMELVLPACMLLSDWGRAGSIDSLLGRVHPSAKAEQRRRQGLALFAVVLVFGMVTAGVPKAIDWIDFDLHTSGFLGWYYPNRYAVGRAYLLSAIVPHVPLLVLEVGDYFATFLELSGFLALLASARWFRLWLAVAELFHLLNDLTLNISFLGQMLLYAVFVNYQRCSAPVATVCAALARRPVLAGVGLVVAIPTAIHLVARWGFDTGFGVILAPGIHRSYLIQLYVTIPVGVTLLALLGRDAIAAGAARPGAKVHGS